MTLFLLFCRYLPTVAMAEVKTVMPQAHAHAHALHGVDAQRTDYRPDEHHDPDRDAPRLQESVRLIMSTELKDIHDSHGADASILDAGPRLTGLLAEFDGCCRRRDGRAENVRAAGYKVWDVHSPFPIHGIDAVIGIRPTILPWLVLCGGLTGLCTGFALQWYCNAYDYPFLISGKPILSLPANIPIIFECTVLFSALTAVFGMFGLNRCRCSTIRCSRASVSGE